MLFGKSLGGKRKYKVRGRSQKRISTIECLKIRLPMQFCAITSRVRTCLKNYSPISSVAVASYSPWPAPWEIVPPSGEKENEIVYKKLSVISGKADKAPPGGSTVGTDKSFFLPWQIKEQLTCARRSKSSGIAAYVSYNRLQTLPVL